MQWFVFCLLSFNRVDNIHSFITFIVSEKKYAKSRLSAKGPRRKLRDISKMQTHLKSPCRTVVNEISSAVLNKQI